MMSKSLHKLLKQSKTTSHKKLITLLASVFFCSAEMHSENKLLSHERKIISDLIMSQSKQDDSKYTATLHSAVVQSCTKHHTF